MACTAKRANTEPAAMRVSTLAERSDCSPGKIRAMIAAGDLPHLRQGKMVRIPVSAVIAYEARCQDQTPPPLPSPEKETGTSTGGGNASPRAARIARRLRPP